MARKKARPGSDVASQIAAFIGKSIGSLSARKDALQRELADVDRQLAGVRDSVMASFGGGAEVRRRPGRKAGVVKAAKASKRVMSPEARAKMAESAKRRWAAAKKAGKKTLG